jgi:hypothetical protein
MVITKTMQSLIDNPKMLNGDYGSNAKIAKTLNTTVDDVIESKFKLRSMKSAIEFAKDIKEKTDSKPWVTGSDFDLDNKNQKMFIKTPKPLSPKEIEELVQVDGINTRVARVWNKSNKAGTEWDYSVDIRYGMTDFYSKEELSQKLKELLPSVKPQSITVTNVPPTEDMLIIYISDIHAGAVNSELSIFDNNYSESILNIRLDKVLQEAIDLGKSFQKVAIVNLGDSVDGYDGFTVSRKHHLGSESNKRQFDIFVHALSHFYNKVLNSGLGEEYMIWNCLNSNHDGNGMSYMANKAVELHISSMYPDVIFKQQEKFIDGFEIGTHKFYFTHGKDAKLMKYPMKKYVDDKLDAWMMQYTQQFGNGVYEWNHLRRGDLHMFVHEYCKFGDSLLVPSVYGSSEYIEINYGNTRAGAVLEQVSSSKRATTVTPIWF